MRPLRIDVRELVGIPYLAGGLNPREGVDCLWASREALYRIFPDFAGHELPSSAAEEATMLVAVKAGETRWRVIGRSAAAATCLGDLLQGRRPNGCAWVAVIVDQVGRLALTSTRELGVHLVRLADLGGVERVARRMPA